MGTETVVSILRNVSASSVLLLPTAYVVRREGYVLTRVCPSIRLSTPRGGGTRARSRWGGGGTPARSDRRVPQPGPGGGGVPHLAGGYPPSDLARGYPTSGTPPSDLGVPLLGEVPHLGYHPCQTWPGGTPPRVTDGVLDMPRSVSLLRSRRRTFLFLFITARIRRMGKVLFSQVFVC